MSRTATRRPRRVSPTVLKLSTLMRRTASATFRRELGLQPAEWGALALIGDDGPLSQGELCGLMAQDKGQVSRVVAALVAEGMVERRIDARRVTLSLGAAGRPVYRRLTLLSHDRNRRLLAGLQPDEVAVLFHCLDVMTRNAQQLMASEDAASLNPRQASG